MRDECPHCGADLAPNAKVCPECGSDEQTGWSEAAKEDALGIPDESFNYNEFVQREFEGKDVGSRSFHWVWWLVAVVLLAAFALVWFHR